LAKAVKSLKENGISPELEVEIEFEQKMEKFLSEIKEIKKPKSVKRQRKSVPEKQVAVEDVDAV